MSEFDRLAGELQARLEQLVASTLGRLERQLPDLFAETAFSREEIGAFVRVGVQAELRAFRNDALPEGCPEVDAAAARTVAGAGDLKLLLNAYWAVRESLWEGWFDLVEADGDPPLRRALLGRGGEFFSAYARLLSDFVAEVYQRELQRAVRDPQGRRLQSIRGLLEGDRLAAASLDYDLERHHLGLVAWGPDAEQGARDLATLLGRPLLLVGPVNREWWGWISGGRALAPNEEKALERFRPPSTAGLALGLQGFGESGFRTTHRQAQRAHWAAGAAMALYRYADVAVESLAAENEEEALAFVARELRGINDDSAISRRIRETLAAYFAAQHNAASAAMALGVHQQTVANRLRSAEERLGHPIGTRRVELELALRLRGVLTPES